MKIVLFIFLTIGLTSCDNFGKRDKKKPSPADTNTNTNKSGEWNEEGLQSSATWTLQVAD